MVYEHGWPDDYTTLPGVGRYTAGALAAQADERADAIGVDVNITASCSDSRDEPCRRVTRKTARSRLRRVCVDAIDC